MEICHRLEVGHINLGLYALLQVSPLQLLIHLILHGDTEPTTWYEDQDGDGYGDPATASRTCPAPGLVSNGLCDDTNAAIRPGATELPGDNVDQNCDGSEICYRDADDDGYRPDATSTTNSADTDCNDANEAIATDPTTDCDDNDATINPGANDRLNDGIDQDCSGADLRALLYVVERFNGTVWAFDAETAAVAWTRTGFGQMIGVAHTDDNVLYVSRYGDA